MKTLILSLLCWVGDTQGRLHLLRREREREMASCQAELGTLRYTYWSMYSVLSIFVILCSFQLLTDDVWPLGGE